MTLQMNRRDFMTGAGALVVSVLLPGVPAKAATQASRLALKPDQLSSYISINQDGSAVGWVGITACVCALMLLAWIASGRVARLSA